MKDLYIGTTGETLVDASVYGVKMGDSFLDALNAPSALKEFVTNESRLIHGRQITIDPLLLRQEYREVSLSFRIEAAYDPDIEKMREDFRSKRKAFYELLYKAMVDIYIPKDAPEVCYHLVYRGKSSQHSQNIARTACTITCKFEECNPNDRKVPNFFVP